jgi:hypothetical protein
MQDQLCLATENGGMLRAKKQTLHGAWGSGYAGDKK